MDLSSRRSLALVSSPADELASQRSAFIEEIAQEVAHIRNAGQYLDDLIGEGHLLLQKVLEHTPDVALPAGVALSLCRNRIKWRMMDWLRKERRQNVVSIDRIEHVDEGVLPFERVRDEQIRRRLKRGVIELPSPERKVLERIYWDGHKQREIADELGLDQPEVSRMHRSSLRRILPFVVEAAA